MEKQLQTEFPSVVAIPGHSIKTIGLSVEINQNLYVLPFDRQQQCRRGMQFHKATVLGIISEISGKPDSAGNQTDGQIQIHSRKSSVLTGFFGYRNGGAQYHDVEYDPAQIDKDGERITAGKQPISTIEKAGHIQ